MNYRVVSDIMGNGFLDGLTDYIGRVDNAHEVPQPHYRLPRGRPVDSKGNTRLNFEILETR